MHPWTSNDIAKARSEEKLARGLAAYRASKVGEEQTADSESEAATAGRIRLVDRLRRREAGTQAPARPAI